MNTGPSRQARTKRVLCVMYHFPPLGGVPVMRSLRLVKYLPKFGWQPTVLTSDRGFDPVHGDDKTLINKVPKNTEVLRVRDPLGKIFSFILNKLNSSVMLQVDRLSKLLCFPDEKIFWGVFTYWKLCRMSDKFKSIDVIYATGFPWSSLLLGALLKKRFSKPLFVDFRDAWSKNPTPLWRKGRLHHFLERKIIEISDRIILATSGLKEEYQKLYPNMAHRMFTIYNGFDPEDYENNLHLDRKQDRSHIEVIYAGSLSDAIPPRDRSQSLVPFLEGLLDTKNRYPEIYNKIFVRIFSNEISRTKAFASDLSVTERISFNSRVSHKEIISKLMNMDVLLLIVMKAGFSKYMTTAKLFEYIAAGKPILAIAPPFSEAAKIIAKYNLGVVVYYEDIPTGVTKAFCELVDNSGWESHDGRPSEAKATFNGIHLVGKFVNQFEGVL